jgi:hypothetical protein
MQIFAKVPAAALCGIREKTDYHKLLRCFTRFGIQNEVGSAIGRCWTSDCVLYDEDQQTS